MLEILFFSQSTLVIFSIEKLKYSALTLTNIYKKIQILQTFIILTNLLKNQTTFWTVLKKKQLLLLFQSIGKTKSTLTQTILYKTGSNFATCSSMYNKVHICSFFVIFIDVLEFSEMFEFYT